METQPGEGYRLARGLSVPDIEDAFKDEWLAVILQFFGCSRPAEGDDALASAGLIQHEQTATL